jgi:hypothetical protein
MARTKTGHLSTVTIDPAQLSFQTPYEPKSRMKATIAPGTTFDTGLHWHELHDEFFQVSQGVIKLVLEDANNTLQTIYVDKNSGVMHAVSRLAGLFHIVES